MPTAERTARVQTRAAEAVASGMLSGTGQNLGSRIGLDPAKFNVVWMGNWGVDFAKILEKAIEDGSRDGMVNAANELVEMLKARMMGDVPNTWVRLKDTTIRKKENLNYGYNAEQPWLWTAYLAKNLFEKPRVEDRRSNGIQLRVSFSTKYHTPPEQQRKNPLRLDILADILSNGRAANSRSGAAVPRPLGYDGTANGGRGQWLNIRLRPFEQEMLEEVVGYEMAKAVYERMKASVGVDIGGPPAKPKKRKSS